MVRALPNKKTHAEKKKGTEPLGRKVKEKQITVEENSTPSRKKHLKELPAGILPKTENPNLDKEWEDNYVKVLLEFEKKIERQTPPRTHSKCAHIPKTANILDHQSPQRNPNEGGGQ
jgi:hypothetical protein